MIDTGRHFLPVQVHASLYLTFDVFDLNGFVYFILLVYVGFRTYFAHGLRQERFIRRPTTILEFGVFSCVMHFVGLARTRRCTASSIHLSHRAAYESDRRRQN